MNARVFKFAKEKRILIKPCPAYVHELNGTTYIDEYGQMSFVRSKGGKEILA